MKLETKLNHFYDSVIEDATNQANTIIQDYEKSLQKIYQDKKNDELRKARLTLRVETDHMIRQKNKTLSVQKIEIKKVINKKTCELKDLLFEDIKQKLLAYMKTETYLDLLAKQIISASEFARDDQITIYINPSDRDKKDSLEQKTGIILTISQFDFIGGTRAVIHSKNILIDNSFLTKLTEEKEIFTF